MRYALPALFAAVGLCPFPVPGDELPSPLPPEALTAELDVWAWNIAAASLENLVPGFNEAYPQVKVNVNMTGTNLQSRFLLSLAAGVGAPDISQLQLREAPRYAVTKRLTDLTPVAAKYAKNFPPSFWENCVHDGHVYAIPWDMGPCGIFYKRDLLERYAIDPASIETWDDYIAAGKTLIERSGGKTRMLTLATGSLTDIFEILMQQNGAQIFDAQGRVALRSVASVEALEVIERMIDAGIGANMPTWGHAFLASLKSDSVATYPMAAWFGGTIRDYAPDTAGNWGVFRLPAMRPGGLRTSNLGGSVLVIPDQCQQKAAAWAYIEYCLCKEAPQIEQYRQFDLFPALLSTHSDPFFDAPDPFFGDQDVRRLFSKDIEQIPVLHRTTDWMAAVRYLTQSLSQWAAGDRVPPAELLDRLAKKLAQRLGRELAPAVEGDAFYAR